MQDDINPRSSKLLGPNVSKFSIYLELLIRDMYLLSFHYEMSLKR